MATLTAQENSPKSYPYHFGTVRITITTNVEKRLVKLPRFQKETRKTDVSALADH